MENIAPITLAHITKLLPHRTVIKLSRLARKIKKQDLSINHFEFIDSIHACTFAEFFTVRQLQKEYNLGSRSIETIIETFDKFDIKFKY